MHGMPISKVTPLGPSESTSLVNASSGPFCSSSAGSGGNVSFVTIGDLPPDDLPLDLIVSVDLSDLRVAVEVVLDVFLCWSGRLLEVIVGLDPPCLSFPFCGAAVVSSPFFSEVVGDFPLKLLLRLLLVLSFFSLGCGTESCGGPDAVVFVLGASEGDFFAVAGEVWGRLRSAVLPEDTLLPLGLVIVLTEWRDEPDDRLERALPPTAR